MGLLSHPVLSVVIVIVVFVFVFGVVFVSAVPGVDVVIVRRRVTAPAPPRRGSGQLISGAGIGSPPVVSP
ncbi:hypothetical protein ABZX40_31410 [Streptomyces sp. NPDC004610]|uniref:hypothetical protein n=1 Tax=unclassified Streptomyces TaxID=2593676 RepID=UPI0033B7AD94